MAKEKFYITTAIIYANAKPHIGFALEVLQADAIARWQRLLGKEVYFLTGTDEHGTKIYAAAQAAGVDPQVFVDTAAKAAQEMLVALNISNYDFIRTSDKSRHWPTATKVWESLASSGDIVPGHYQGYYSVTDEAYITKTDFEAGGYDPAKVIELSEDNYIFQLSKYNKSVTSAIDSKELTILPSHRAKEMLNFAKPGLSDVSFSRPKDKLPWGIPVPGDSGQTMYVWCDALTNYISALGYAEQSADFKRFWPADVQVIGKDIIRFHALIWPGMLGALGLPLPHTLLVHGHVLSEGQKMSKSVGNVVDPMELVNRLGVDPVRYYLLCEIPTFDDGDFSATRFEEVYEANLANDLGNLLNRTLVMAQKYLPEGMVATPVDPFNTADFWQTANSLMDEYAIDKTLNHIWAMVRRLNQYIDTKKPWEQAKTDQASAGLTVAELMEGLRHIGLSVHPFMPDASRRIFTQLGLAGINEEKDTFASLSAWGLMPIGHKIGTPTPLFPKNQDSA